MRSSLCLCSSLMPTATGTGTMPPYRQAQYASMNCSLLATCRISLSPWRAPDALQVEQDAERAPAQVGETQGLLGVLALEVDDRGRAAAAVVEHLASASGT